MLLKSCPAPLALLFAIACLASMSFIHAQEPGKPPAQPQAVEEAEKLYGRARQREREGNYDEAARIYKDIITQFPKHSRAGCALTNIAFRLKSQERYDEAIETFQRVLQEYPDARYGNGKLAASFAAYEIATCFHKKGDVDEAMAAFDEAVKKYPDATTEGGTPLSELFLKAVEGEGGKRPRGGGIGPLVKGAGGPAQELYNSAQRAARQQPEEGLRLYEELLAKYPKDPLAPLALIKMAYITARGKGFPEAVPILQRVIQEYPEARYSWGERIAGEAAYRIGVFYYKNRDMLNAKRAFDFAVEKYKDAKTSSGMLFSTSFDSYIRVTNVAVAKGEEWLRKEMRIPTPGDPAERLYREAYFRTGDESLGFYDELIAKFPQHERMGEALIRSTRMLVTRKRNAEAIQRLQQIVEKYPNAQWPNGTTIAPEAAYMIGGIYFMQKDMPNAKKAFDYALQHYPDARSDEGDLLAQRHSAEIQQVNLAVGK
ncbi:MAG: tetratricopeptide repeat protein [Planctomycetota bacterium]